MNSLTSRLVARSIAQPQSLRRAVSSTPSRAFASTHPFRAKHAVPPEGDIDHGRSGWGFQSHSRHEHFTFPGEDPKGYETNETFNTPFFWTLGITSVLLVVFWDSVPTKPKTIFTPESYAPQNYPNRDKTGPDDDRTYYNRVHDWYYRTPEQDFQVKLAKTQLDRVNAEISRTRQSKVELVEKNFEHIDRRRPNTGTVIPPWAGPGEARDMQDVEHKSAYTDAVKYVPDYYKDLEKTNPTLSKNYESSN